MEWPVTYGVATGEMHGKRLIVQGRATVWGRDYYLRTTYVKHSNDAFALMNEERRPDGTWLKDDKYDFTRVK